MSLDQHARRFFEILREQKGDSTGETLYTDAARQSLHESGLPFFEDLPDDYETLLDIGCGAGFDAAYFARKGKSVTAITANPTPAQERFAIDNRFRLLEMDMNDLHFADGSLDAVLCKHVLEHSFSPLGSLLEIRRVLKPDGYLFLVLPPHHEKLVESGHFTQGWSLGQVIYCLCVTGFDVANGAFRVRPGHLDAVIRPSASLPAGRGLYELKERMPLPIRQIMQDDKHGAFPVRSFSQIAWPFAGPERRTVQLPPEELAPTSLRRLLKIWVGSRGRAGRAMAKLLS